MRDQPRDLPLRLSSGRVQASDTRQTWALGGRTSFRIPSDVKVLYTGPSDVICNIYPIFVIKTLISLNISKFTSISSRFFEAWPLA